MNPGAGALVAVMVVATALALAGARGASTRGRAVRRVRPGPGAVAVSTPPWLAARLGEMGLDVPSHRLVRIAPVAAGAVAVWALAAGGPSLVVLAAVAVVGGGALAWAVTRHRGDELVEAAVPHALDAVARSLRSGASLLQALDEVAVVGPARLRGDLAMVAASAARGRGVAAALDDWALARPLPSVRLAVAALALGAETGGAQARSVDGVAATVRLRQALAGDARAMAAQARLSAAVIAVAPLGFGALAAATDPRVADVLLRTPLGLALLTLGLGLDALGAWWMSLLTRPAA